MDIIDYLDPELVFFISEASREKVLETIVNKLEKTKKISDKEAFHQAIIDREEIVSTGIGMGVAIPHAKMTNYENFFIVVVLLDQAVEWDSLDGAPVRLIFMIGGPDDKQTEYLQILSSLTVFIRDEERRKKILNSRTVENIINLFSVN